MAHQDTAAAKAQTAPPPDDARKPDSPTEIERPSWTYTAKASFAEFQRDQCTDLAAALTYYSVLSVFPAILALVSLLGVFGRGQETTDAMLEILRDLGQSQIADRLEEPIAAMVGAQSAGLALAIGLAGALWGASGYVGAFGRALNRIYQVDEGRPVWKLRPIVLLVTLGLVVMAAIVLVGLVVSGPIAQAIGEAVGFGEQSLAVWNLAKWPVILGVVVVMVAVLYYATPNVKQPKFRWMSVGAAVAIGIWVIASLGFGFYVSNFARYDSLYGSLGSVIVFLLWLWLTNLALLFGAEVDAELERARQLQAGIRAERTLQLPPRDDSVSRKAASKLEQRVAEGRRLRLEAEASAGGDADSSGNGRGRGRHGRTGAARAATASDVELEPLPSELARRS
ncbi:YihY/virulence factor BrkB family protein [Fodinibacter luteus]|uniref:YihY/virulence factor BrkB family protein n=1 Tax=Fodinibacter luteus TaxID=552064 RepID=A0ABP8KNR2_9MICO